MIGRIIVIILLITTFSITGFKFFSGLANTILVTSLKELAPSMVMLDLEFITFNKTLILTDCLVIAIIALISTIIPMVFLKRIKPISIIKAKE